MIYDNWIALEAALNMAIKNAALYAADKILQELKNIIQTNVYAAYTPQMYVRTNQFKDSWRYIISDGDNEAVVEFNQDLTKMVFNPDMWQHGSPEEWDMGNGHIVTVNGAGDARADLADYIENGVAHGFFGRMEARSFWKPFENNIKSGEYDDYILEGLRLQGLNTSKGLRWKNIGLSNW